MRLVVWLLLVAVYIGSISSNRLSHAQQASANYTGRTSSVDQAGMLAGRRRFEPGARSAWHTHPAGQLIFVEEGRARMQRRGEPIRDDLGPHESAFTEADVPRRA